MDSLEIPIFKLPKIKNKIIWGTAHEFEQWLDEFVEGLESYSIQYKPILVDNRVSYTALITYPEPEEEESNVHAD